jgi:23S rRNA pseudouridine2605 synthase
MHLNKYLAHAGVCSRRKAVELIQTERVTVNGTIVAQPAFQVPENAKVAIDGEGIKCHEKVYIMMNKPRGYLTTVSDERSRRTVIDLLSNKIRNRVYPVGRLDQDTSGLLLLTNDGQFAQHIAHPRNNIAKEYRVVLNRPLLKPDFEAIKAGVWLMDGKVKVDHIAYMSTKHKYTQLLVTLHSGKNRIVRRLFEHFSYEVILLERVAINTLGLDRLPVGHWRPLTPHEVEAFFNATQGVRPAFL